MPTRNVSLTEHLDNFITEKIETGRYENASEVVRAALRALEHADQEHEARITALTKALEDGLSSGIVTGDLFAKVRRRLDIPERAEPA
jgi:antitoxin ParD1/3/4